MIVDELIERARELSKLYAKATPGTWSYSPSGAVYAEESLAYVATTTQRDAPLICAAPEMALLLGRLADELSAR